MVPKPVTRANSATTSDDQGDYANNEGIVEQASPAPSFVPSPPDSKRSSGQMSDVRYLLKHYNAKRHGDDVARSSLMCKNPAYACKR